jgi:hypothetical protein
MTKKKLKKKSILLVLTVIFLYSFSTINNSVAQESINITSHGCIMCNVEENNYFVNWTWTGNIPEVSIYFYNLSMTIIEYIIVENTANLGTYEWGMPLSHTLDGNYSLVVCDSSNHKINDSVVRFVYPIQTFHTNIPGYPILLTGVTIGIISVIVAVSLTKKLRKR